MAVELSASPMAKVPVEACTAPFGRIGVPLNGHAAPALRAASLPKANTWQDFTETDTFRFWHPPDLVTPRGHHLEIGGGIVSQLSRGVGLWVRAEYTTDNRHRQQR